jgi:acyl dehydratase
MSADTVRLEPFVRETGFEYWNRYAAVNDEFIPIHMYDEAGQAAGYPTAFGMGNLTWSYIHLAIHSWFGDTAVIARVAGQFRNAVIRGTVLSVEGEVASTEEQGSTVTRTLQITVKNQQGELIAPVEATVVTTEAE